MNRRKKAIIALTFLVAAAVGFESWQAAAEAAKTGGRPHPMLWPVTLEAFIAVLVLVYWEARSENRKPTAARLLLWGTTLLASTVQVLDVLAGEATKEKLALGIVTAAWTPIALNLTVEFATWLLYGKPAPVNPPAGVGERVPESHAQAPAPTSRAAASSRPVRAAEAGREHPEPTSSPRERLPEREGRPGGSTPELEPARRALVTEHAYDDGGERMGDRRVCAALEAAGHVVPRAVVRQALADLPERRNGHKVVAQ